MFNLCKLSRFSTLGLVLGLVGVRVRAGRGSSWYMNTDSSTEAPEVMATVDVQSPELGLFGEKNVKVGTPASSRPVEVTLIASTPSNDIWLCECMGM